MNQLKHKIQGSEARQRRVRARVSGSNERPRLSVIISAKHVSAQLIDDGKGVTLAASSSVNNKTAGSNMLSKSSWVGADIAKKAKQHKIKRVVLDRGNKLYHGRIKALAEAARKEGLEF